jgi:HK97 family phage portal protein
MLPLKLFRRLPGGGSEPATDDPRYYLVHDSPNGDMTTMMYRSSRIAQQINAGNCFSEIERNRAGQAVALHPIHASRIPEKNIRRGPDNRLRYFVNNNLTEPTELRDVQVLHVPSPISDDGIIGRGVVAAARLSIGFGLATENQGAAYFGNSARPKIVVKGGKFKEGRTMSVSQMFGWIKDDMLPEVREEFVRQQIAATRYLLQKLGVPMEDPGDE